MDEKSHKFFSSHSMFAPRSKTTFMLFLFGHNPARAGLLIPGIVLRRSLDITNIAPVFPADNVISAFLFFINSIAFHMLDSLPFLAAARGLSLSDMTLFVSIISELALKSLSLLISSFIKSLFPNR